jgi:protein-S-isoprenylcysteine O-methyltransferase
MSSDTLPLRHFSDKRGYGTIALCGGFLGLVFGIHLFWLCVSATNTYEMRWCLYAISMSAFHFGEFALTAAHQPHEVTADSFLLNHSRAYGIAAVASWIEFWAEVYLTPGLKRGIITLFIGTTCVVCGQILRSLAMGTAATNFTHLVATHRRHGHELVTHGVYSIFRHPAYVGWFVWSVGTQVLLANPVCACAYTVASWRFFAARIPFEEEALIDFFGDEYATFARKTIGIFGIPSPAQEISLANAAARQKEAEEALSAAAGTR